jgi:hypothetical protein
MAGTQRTARPRVSFSFQNIMTGSDLSRRRLAVMKSVSGHPGPVVWLTGCAHGDEVGGIVVIQEVFKRLRRRRLLKGELHAFPLMNPLGFEVAARNVAVSGEDLNRCFPGRDNGSVAQRIAHTIFTTITRTPPTLVLDLHNDWRSSMPYAVLDPQPDAASLEAFSRAREFAQHSGLLIVAEMERSPDALVSHKTLSGSLLRHGVPALTLELGEAHVVNEDNVRHGIHAVWNILSSLGMTTPDDDPVVYPLPNEFRGRILSYYDHLLSSTSGVVRFVVSPGDIVTPGGPVARIYNAFGKLLETIVSPHPGIVLGHSDSSVAFPGVTVAALGVV